MGRKPLVILAVIAVAIILAAVALPYVVNADQFRPKVEREATAALGREVKIARLDLSVFRGGVVANDLSVADDPNFSRTPFVQARSIAIGVEMWPLIFSREVHVTSVDLVEPQITLIRNTNGKWNFDSLGASPGTKKSSNATPNAAVAMAVSNLQISDGKLTVTQSGKSRVYDKVNVKVGNFSDHSEFPFSLEANTPGGGKVSVNGQAGPIKAGDMAQTPLRADVNIEDLDLGASGFFPPSSGIGGKMDYKGNAGSDGEKLHSEGKVKVSKFRAVKNGGPATENVTLDYASDLDLSQRRGTLTRGDILIGDGKARLNGNFDTRGEAILVDARLKGDGMPLDQLAGILPAFGVILPGGSKLQGGSVNADLQLRGPLDQLVTTGPIQVANAKLSGFNLKSQASAISSLAGIPSASDLIIQALNSNLRVAPEGIRADNIHLVLPSIGTITGDGTIGSNGSLNFRMQAQLAGGGGLIGGMSNLSTLGQSKGGVPFLIQGTTSQPIFLPDFAGAVGNTLSAPVQGVLGGLFGKKKK